MRSILLPDYREYALMPAFWCGHADYIAGRLRCPDANSVEAQAYDRGAEYAMRLMRGEVAKTD